METTTTTTQDNEDQQDPPPALERVINLLVIIQLLGRILLIVPWKARDASGSLKLLDEAAWDALVWIMRPFPWKLDGRRRAGILYTDMEAKALTTEAMAFIRLAWTCVKEVFGLDGIPDLVGILDKSAKDAIQEVLNVIVQVLSRYAGVIYMSRLWKQQTDQSL